MQRRTGKGAHISPPRENGDKSPELSAAPPSRLNQKTFGLTNRIWIILMLAGFIIFLTRYTLPHDYSMPRHGLTNYANLKPVNYLNDTNSTIAAPFDFCPVFGPADDIGQKHGVASIMRSRVHLGTGARVQRVIHKALSGLPVTISVLGGSISSCHGAGDDPISPKCYPARFFEWWNSVFPHPASELTNGAMRRTNSAYFAYCNTHHLPDLTDLVILEFDAHDPNDKAWMDHFELLVRSILTRKDQPAVIILGHFSPQVAQHYAFDGPDQMHNIVAQFYDVPYITLKHPNYHAWVTGSDALSPYYVDPLLASPDGHELISEYLIAYIESQVCDAWAVATGKAFDIVSPLLMLSDPSKAPPTDARGLFGGAGPREGIAPGEEKDDDDESTTPSDTDYSPYRVPAARIHSRPTDKKKFEEVQPFCVSANDLINPLPPSLFYGSGWHAQHPGTGLSTLSSYSHYWYSNLPFSRLRVPLQIGAGEIAVYYLKEPRADVEEVGSGVECWVDDNYAGAKVLNNAGDVGEPTPVLEMIDHGVSRGSHFVECQLMGEEGRSVPAFKLLGIFAT